MDKIEGAEKFKKKFEKMFAIIILAFII